MIWTGLDPPNMLVGNPLTAMVSCLSRGKTLFPGRLNLNLWTKIHGYNSDELETVLDFTASDTPRQSFAFTVFKTVIPISKYVGLLLRKINQA